MNRTICTLSIAILLCVTTGCETLQDVRIPVLTDVADASIKGLIRSRVNGETDGTIHIDRIEVTYAGNVPENAPPAVSIHIGAETAEQLHEGGGITASQGATKPSIKERLFGKKAEPEGTPE